MGSKREMCGKHTGEQLREGDGKIEFSDAGDDDTDERQRGRMERQLAGVVGSRIRWLEFVFQIGVVRVLVLSEILVELLLLRLLGLLLHLRLLRLLRLKRSSM